MCLLSFYKPGVQPNADELACGARCNADGSGFAIIIDGRIEIGKSMRGQEAIDTFVKMRKKHPKGYALFHSRYGTHGTTNLDNVHPFYVAGTNNQTVIAHNGIMPGAVRPRRGNPLSDTRIVAEKFLPAFGSLHRGDRRKAFGKWMTSANKVVVLSVDPRFAEPAYIVNEDQGHWTDAGIWYSNYGYERSSFYAGTVWTYPSKWSRRVLGSTATRWSEESVCWDCGYSMLGDVCYRCEADNWPTVIGGNPVGPICDWCANSAALCTSCATDDCAALICGACMYTHNHFTIDGRRFGSPYVNQTLDDVIDVIGEDAVYDMIAACYQRDKNLGRTGDSMMVEWRFDRLTERRQRRADVASKSTSLEIYVPQV